MTTRSTGRRRSPASQRPTYQEVLDESLEETFPASDPIAAGSAAHAGTPIETGRDATDWLIRPGSEAEVTPPGEIEAPVKAPRRRGARR